MVLKKETENEDVFYPKIIFFFNSRPGSSGSLLELLRSPSGATRPEFSTAFWGGVWKTWGWSCWERSFTPVLLIYSCFSSSTSACLWLCVEQFVRWCKGICTSVETFLLAFADHQICTYTQQFFFFMNIYLCRCVCNWFGIDTISEV